MKAPKRVALNKRVSREKKKFVVDSGSDECIAAQNTHTCPGKLYFL